MTRTWGDFGLALVVSLTLSTITVGGACVMRIVNPVLLSNILDTVYGVPR